MASRFDDLSPKSQQELEELGDDALDQDDLEAKQASLKKALEMPMYNNNDLVPDEV